MLDILVENTATHDAEKETLMVYLKYTKGKNTKPKNKIRINKPWEIWIRANQKKLPYNVGKQPEQ